MEGTVPDASGSVLRWFCDRYSYGLDSLVVELIQRLRNSTSFWYRLGFQYPHAVRVEAEWR